MAIKISERFAEQCSVVHSNNYDTCGSVTRASVAYLTAAELEAMFTKSGLFAELDAWFKTAIEMKACGTPTVSMYEWIMSSAKLGKGKMVGTTPISDTVSLVQPFIFGRQSSVINVDYWAISTGWAKGAYTAAVTGPLVAGQLDDLGFDGAAGERVIRVISPYGVDLDAKWFNERTTLHILSRTGGVVEDGAWVVIASAVATDNSYVDVYIQSQNAGSSAAFDASPTAGIVLIGTNNVADVESWCHNMPNWDPKKRVPFWIQTNRRTRCVDSEYIKFYDRLRTAGNNQAFREFGDIDLAQRNAQDELNYKKRFVHDFFFNKPISANQTLGLYNDLDDTLSYQGLLLDPGTGGKLMGKKANYIGVVEQLRRCDRVRDLLGHSLNFYEWLDENYRIKRARESNGRRVTDIDWYTDSITAANMDTAFLQYWKQESLEQFRLTMEIGKSNELGMNFTRYRVKRPAGLNINIIVDNFFDDFRDANKAQTQEPVGSMLLALDIGKGGSIYWAPIKSNKKSFTVGQLSDLARIDKDWSCVMETVTAEKTLISETGTVVVECPQENLWIWGMADAVPLMTGPTANEDNLY